MQIRKEERKADEDKELIGQTLAVLSTIILSPFNLAP
jgi:hypothetical protein